MTDNLNKEEKDILESFERGEWKSIPHLDERKKELKSYTSASLKKDK